MAKMDKLILWGSFAVMAAVGSLSVWKTAQAPKVVPAIARLEAEYKAIWNTRIRCGPVSPIPPIAIDFNNVVKQPERAHDWTAFISTQYVGIPKQHPPVTVFVLPVAVATDAKSDLDGARITWTTSEAPAALKDWMVRKEGVPTNFVIQRRSDDGELREFVVDGKARAYADLSAKPRTTYRYRVTAVGQESDLSKDPPVPTTAAKGSAMAAETRTPSATRLKLVGGAPDHAILSVETYDRSQKKWVGKLAPTVVPGRAVGTSGWTLKALRFDKFTLVAELTDDEGVDRILTTKD
jgi:hypothetical protein